MASAGITNEQLAFAAGISARHIYNIRTGKMETTRPKMAAILSACRQLSNRKRVTITDIFDFEVAEAA